MMVGYKVTWTWWVDVVDEDLADHSDLPDFIADAILDHEAEGNADHGIKVEAVDHVMQPQSWVDAEDTAWKLDPTAMYAGQFSTALQLLDDSWSKEELDRVWVGARKLFELGLGGTLAECFATAMIFERG